MQHRLRFIGAKGVHSDSQLSYLFFQYFGLDNGSTLPKLLNLSGFRFVFKEPVYWHSVFLYDKKRGEYLWSWNSPHDRWCKETKVVLIERMHSRDLLEYNTDYEITIYTRNFDCDVVETVIQFRTKPQRSTVEEPEPVMQERPPVVPSGELGELHVTIVVDT